MSTKFIVGVVLAVGIVIAIFEGVPQNGWHWFQSTALGTEIYSYIDGRENLSGLLRGPLSDAESANLTNTGIVEWTNKQRADQGLQPLHDNELLRKAAEAKVDDMFAQQYFEHKSPDGKMPSDIIKATGYSYVMVGENLALGNFRTDEILVQAWMDSPGHRANILNTRYEEIGTAARKGMYEGKEIWLAVQEFGTPLSSCPGPVGGIKDNIDSNRTKLSSLQAGASQMKSEIDSNRYSSKEEYDAAVAKYNALASQINQLSDDTQQLVTRYNEGVNSFNKCLESN